MENPTFTTATEQAAAVKNREVSSVELLEEHLAQIERHNEALNSIVTLDTERALNRAREADAAPHAAQEHLIGRGGDEESSAASGQARRLQSDRAERNGALLDTVSDADRSDLPRRVRHDLAVARAGTARR